MEQPNLRDREVFERCAKSVFESVPSYEERNMSKRYRCLDEDCGNVTDEFRRLKLREGVYKCPKCRGRLEEICDSNLSSPQSLSGEQPSSSQRENEDTAGQILAG